MHYEVYIDVVFLTNLLMDYILLWFVGKGIPMQKKLFQNTAGSFSWGIVFQFDSLYPL